jgi:hypothetical protein
MSRRQLCARSRRHDEPTLGPNQAEVLIIGRPLSRDLVAGPGVGKRQSGHPEK